MLASAIYREYESPDVAREDQPEDAQDKTPGKVYVSYQYGSYHAVQEGIADKRDNHHAFFSIREMASRPAVGTSNAVNKDTKQATPTHIEVVSMPRFSLWISVCEKSIMTNHRPEETTKKESTLMFVFSCSFLLIVCRRASSSSANEGP
jgi:hypothetical protein